MNQKINEIVLASTNRGKLTELQSLLKAHPVTVRNLDHFPPVPIAEETGQTFAQNARLKASHYSRLLNRYVLADDSGLLVDAIDQAPGIYSARFAGIDGPDRDHANNQKLIQMLKNIPQEERTAKFCCALCLAAPDQILIEVEGSCPGQIIDTPHGSNGFGYDPIFFLAHKNKTIAQLTAEQKNQFSHRGNALRKMIPLLEPYLS